MKLPFVMCAMMHWRSMFETVTPGISGHTAQAEPTAATIAKRFSALAQMRSPGVSVFVPLVGVERTSVGGARTNAIYEYTP